MFQRLVRRAAMIRGDTVIAAAIPTGCALLLLEAYFRTENGDADVTCDAQFAPSDACIEHAHQTMDIVRALERNGIVVIPNAISRASLQCARDDVRNYQHRASAAASRCDDGVNTAPGFQPSTNAADVRQDTVAWIRQDDHKEPSTLSSEITDGNTSDTSLGTGIDYCIRFLRGIPNALEHYGYSGIANTSIVCSGGLIHHQYRVPRQCQLALYSGDGHASYARHLDRCNATLIDLGLLEWLRLSDYRERRITLILYLNDPDRPPSHGGALRCWVAKETSTASDGNAGTYRQVVETARTTDRSFHPPFDIQPIGGTLVIFQSDRVDHQVLPSTADRFALTNWVSSCAS